MTRPEILGLWVAVVAVLGGCQVLALVDRRHFAGITELLHRLTCSAPRRAVLLLGWMWLGWHLFAR